MAPGGSSLQDIEEHVDHGYSVSAEAECAAAHGP